MKRSPRSAAEVPEARLEPRTLGERVERSRARVWHVARRTKRVAGEGARLGVWIVLGLFVCALFGGVIAAAGSAAKRGEESRRAAQPPTRVGRNLYEIQDELRRLAEEVRARDAIRGFTP